MDKVNDQNDSHARTMELVEQTERDALANETKAAQLQEEADRLMEVAKLKRKEAKDHKSFAESLTRPQSKKTSKRDEPDTRTQGQVEAEARERAALADDPRGAPTPPLSEAAKKDAK